MNNRSEASASFEFGRFRIFPRRREVLADGRPIELGGRAFDVLVVLIEANGAVVKRSWSAASGRAGSSRTTIYTPR